MFKINQFISSINQYGVLKNNRYIVEFGLPEYLKSYEATVLNNTMADGINSLNLISLRCEAAQIPGMSFATVDGPPRIGYGPIESVPYGVTFDDLSLTFILDAHSKIHRMFYDWTNSIVNYHSKGQSQLKEAKGPVKNMSTFEVGYKDKYCTDLNITVYDTDDKPVMKATAYRAFPKLLPSTDLSWNNNDELIKVTVPFTYTDFEIEYYRSTKAFPAQQPPTQ